MFSLEDRIDAFVLEQVSNLLGLPSQFFIITQLRVTAEVYNEDAAKTRSMLIGAAIDLNDVGDNRCTLEYRKTPAITTAICRYFTPRWLEELARMAYDNLHQLNNLVVEALENSQESQIIPLLTKVKFYYGDDVDFLNRSLERAFNKFDVGNPDLIPLLKVLLHELETEQDES